MNPNDTIDAPAESPIEAKAGAKDDVMITAIYRQVFQDGDWQYVYAKPDATETPTPGNPWYPVATNPPPAMWVFNIPQAANGRPFKITGNLVSRNPTWTLKIRIGATPETSTLCTVLQEEINYTEGKFTIDVGGALLGNNVNDFVHVWVEEQTHTPPNPNGIHPPNSILIRRIA